MVNRVGHFWDRLGDLLGGPFRGSWRSSWRSSGGAPEELLAPRGGWDPGAGRIWAGAGWAPGIWVFCGPEQKAGWGTVFRRIWQILGFLGSGAGRDFGAVGAAILGFRRVLRRFCVFWRFLLQKATYGFWVFFRNRLLASEIAVFSMYPAVCYVFTVDWVNFVIEATVF